MHDRPNTWIDQMFTMAADTASDIVADARSKLIDEAWFGRRVPEKNGRGGLGWSLDDHPTIATGSSVAEHLGWDRILHEKTFPDRSSDKARLQALDAKYHRDHPADPSRDPERGIDL